MKCLILLLFVQIAYAQTYKEEAAKLERIYTERATSVMEALIDENQYKLVVVAEINENEEQLKQYNDDLEAKFIPGLPVSPEIHYPTINNRLHALKSRVKVLVVLDQLITDEKEALIKDLLATKLHLNLEDDGDQVIVRRSIFPKVKEEKPSLLPELSWKMWALIALIALLLAAAIIFWRNKKSSEKELEKLYDPEFNAPLNDQIPQVDPSEDAEDEAAREAEEAEKKRQEIMRKQIELVDNINSLSMEYPFVANNAAKDFYMSGNQSDLYIAFDSIGWDVVKKLYSQLPEKIWHQLGSQISTKTEDIEEEEKNTSLHKYNQFLLGRIVQRGVAGDLNNPFTFLFSLGQEEREQLLASESPTNLAIISFYASPTQLGDLVQGLSEDMKQSLLEEISRLQEMPQSSIDASVKNLKTRLENIKANPQKKIDGSSVAANLLRAMDALTEWQVLQKFIKENPKTAERLRRTRLQFMDLGIVPTNLLKDTLTDLDSDVLVSALAEEEADLMARVTALLPPKKAMMVESDISGRGADISLADRAEAKRAVVMAIEKQLDAMNRSVEDLWNEQEASKDEELAEAA